MFRTFDVKNCHADGCLPLMHKQDAKCHATQLFMLTPTMLLGSLFEAEVGLVTTTDDTSGAQLLQVCRLSGILKKIIIHFKTNEQKRLVWYKCTFEERPIHLLLPHPPAANYSCPWAREDSLDKSPVLRVATLNYSHAQ